MTGIICPFIHDLSMIFPVDLPTVIQLSHPEIFGWNDHIFSSEVHYPSRWQWDTQPAPVAHVFKPRQQLSQLLNLVTDHSFVRWLRVRLYLKHKQQALTLLLKILLY